MADIFLSYTEKDRDDARRVADALTLAGWSVWWDRRIPAGETWRNVLERAMQEMRCMVVLWSSRSIESEWVYEEASEGRRQGKLVPVMLEAVRPPAGFREIQAADLTGWDGSREFEGLRLLIGDLERLLGKPAQAATRPEPSERPGGNEAVREPIFPPHDEKVVQPGLLHGKIVWVLGTTLLLAGGVYLSQTLSNPVATGQSGPLTAKPKADMPEQVKAPENPKPMPRPMQSVAPTTATPDLASSEAANIHPAEQLTPVKKPAPKYPTSRCANLLSRQALGETFSPETQAKFDKECRK